MVTNDYSMNFQTIALPTREPEVFEWEIIWPEKKETIQKLKRFKEFETFVEFETVPRETDFLERFFFVYLKRFSLNRCIGLVIGLVLDLFGVPKYEISEINRLEDETIIGLAEINNLKKRKK